ncbi:MAG: hypothetical protein JWQ96_454 [Segetibacter sp.]|nr:hypothetical protein [Segetibacter sp.]
MKAASINDLKQELLALPPKKVLEICLKLARFKKENKELLSFLLFDAENEHGYVESIKHELDENFAELPRINWYATKKSLRKILRLISKYSKHVANKESEVEMLLHFCTKLKVLGNEYYYNQAYSKMYQQQIKKLNGLVEVIHEDIRYDYKRQVEQL